MIGIEISYTKKRCIADCSAMHLFFYSLLKFRLWFKYGLKAQKLLAQGIALGIMAISKAPCKGKSFASINIKH